MSNENKEISKGLYYLFDEMENVDIIEKFDLKTNEAEFLNSVYDKNRYKLMRACFHLGFSRGQQAQLETIDKLEKPAILDSIENMGHLINSTDKPKSIEQMHKIMKETKNP